MLHFASPGSPLSTASPGGSLQGLYRAKELGISAMELEWVQRVPANAEHVEEVGRTARDLGIVLTVHAPYYINLNAQDADKLRSSKKRILSALTMAQIAGARSVCVHPAFYLGMAPEKVYDRVARATEEILRRRYVLFPDVNLAYETMGKPTQFGTLEEVLRISKEFGIYPCVDAAHMHARENGAINTAVEWEAMLNLYERYLGKKGLENMHLHFSGILYGPKGERAHVPLAESDANWREYLAVLKQRSVGGVIVCESPVGEDDVRLMRDTFDRL